MGEKVRILGIAPYKGLVTLMKRYAGQRDDIQLTAMLGNVETGLSLAKEHYRNYDIIISRANTASRIAKCVPIPVIDIGIDYYDVLLCLKTAENTKTKFAVLGFRSLTTIAKSICNVLKIPTDIFSINTTSEANSLLDKLKEQGYKTVICDTVPYNYAKLIGITPILLTSSMESLKAAVDQAVYTWQTHRDLYHSLSLMHQLLDSSANRFLVLSRTGECIYTTLEDEIAVPIQAKLQNELEQCCTGRKRSFFITVNNQMYSITSHLVDETLSPYIIFHIMRSEIPLAYSKYGVTIMDKQAAENSFMDSFYSNTELAREILTNTEDAAPSPSPLSLMITGETGTGKDRVAHIYYAKSPLCDNPLYVINCSLISDKSWDFITKHYNSPFTDNGNTIYISNLDSLQKPKQKQLLSIILDTNMHVRNHLIFSCTQTAGSATPHVVFEYTNALGCILVPIKPLREQKEDIISSAGLYINTLNQELGRQVVGVDDEAAALLEQYEYPYNRTQFKRILKEAVIRTDGPYICAKTIQEVIQRENVLFSGFPFPVHACSGSTKEDADAVPGNSRLAVSHPSPFCLDTSQSLDEMNRDIVHYVLNACKGNQTAAAKKLGISRTTLWRYLNR